MRGSASYSDESTSIDTVPAFPQSQSLRLAAIPLFGSFLHCFIERVGPYNLRITRLVFVIYHPGTCGHYRLMGEAKS